MSDVTTVPFRRDTFEYLGVDIDGDTVRAHYRLDDLTFTETVTFDDGGTMTDAARAVVDVWYLVAGLSYYKAGAARHINLGTTNVGPAGRELLRACLVEGLGEFAVRNNLWLDDVTIEGGAEPTAVDYASDSTSVLTPFGGGIDSIVTVEELRPHVDQTLFVVSPAAGRFDPLEASAAVTTLPIARASRTLDSAIRTPGPSFFLGHVPVTAMVTLLAATSAVRTGRGGVAMSNEHSASVPNLVRDGEPVNHQWSKSWAAEQLISAAVAERLGRGLTVASVLRDRSELWVAERFAGLTDYHPVFRSCNRAFTHDPAARAANWCGECDKCLFINLVLAPFLPRPRLREIFGHEPLAKIELRPQLATLVGLGLDHKPFDCVGDPDECAGALAAVASDPAYADVPWLAEVAAQAGADRTLSELLEPQGVTGVPQTWIS